MTTKETPSVHCNFCIMFMTKQIRGQRTVLEVYDDWLTTTMESCSLSEYLDTVIVPSEGERDEIDANIEELLKVCLEGIDRVGFKDLQPKGIVELAGFFTLIMEFYRSTKKSFEFWENLRSARLVETAYEKVTSSMNEVDDDVKKALKVKVPTLGEFLSANQTIHNFYEKIEQLIEKFSDKETSQELISELNVEEDFMFNFNVEHFKKLADLENVYLEGLKNKTVEVNVVQDYYKVLAYVLGNIENQDDALKHYQFQPEAEKLRFTVLEEFYNSGVVKVLNSIPSNETSEDFCPYVAKSVNQLLILAPVRFLTTLFMKQVKKPELSMPVGNVLKRCRLGLSQKLDGVPISVYVLKHVFGDLQREASVKDQTRPFANLLRSLCKQRVDADKKILEPIVSPTEIIKNIAFGFSENEEILAMNLLILSYFFEAPDNAGRAYPINFDKESGDGIDPAVLLTYVVTLHKLIAKNVQRGLELSVPIVLAKLGAKLHAEKIILDEQAYLNHQLSECLWSFKYFAAKHLFKVVPSLTFEIPAVLYKILPEEQQKKFVPIKFAGHENVTEMEDFLYSVVELALPAPELAKLFFNDLKLDLKMINKADDVEWRAASAVLIASLTNKRVKIDEFLGLMEVFGILAERLDWRLPSLTDNSIAVQKIQVDVEPIFVLGMAVLGDLANQRSKVVGDKMEEPWNPSTQSLIYALCQLINSKMSKLINQYEPKNVSLKNCTQHLESLTTKQLLVSLTQILNLLETIDGLNFPLPDTVVITAIIIQTRKYINKLLPWSAEEFSNLNIMSSGGDKSVLNKGFERVSLFGKREKLGQSQNQSANVSEAELVEKDNEEVEGNESENEKHDNLEESLINDEPSENLDLASERLQRALQQTSTRNDDSGKMDTTIDTVPFEPSLVEETNDTVEILTIEDKEDTDETPKATEVNGGEVRIFVNLKIF